MDFLRENFEKLLEMLLAILYFLYESREPQIS
jgi:hypothetical protein